MREVALRFREVLMPIASCSLIVVHPGSNDTNTLATY